MSVTVAEIQAAASPLAEDLADARSVLARSAPGSLSALRARIVSLFSAALEGVKSAAVDTLLDVATAPDGPEWAAQFDDAGDECAGDDCEPCAPADDAANDDVAAGEPDAAQDVRDRSARRDERPRTHRGKRGGRRNRRRS